MLGMPDEYYLGRRAGNPFALDDDPRGCPRCHGSWSTVYTRDIHVPGDPLFCHLVRTQTDSATWIAFKCARKIRRSRLLQHCESA